MLVRRVILGIVIDLSQSKKSIANAYGSEVYLGQVAGKTVNGIAEGADAYFNRRPDELTTEQAASLAATIRNPTLFSPRANSPRAVAWRIEILQNMTRAHVITRVEYDRAVSAASRK